MEDESMKVKIYDYDDKIKEIKIPEDKQIKSIYVRICSGDETGYINFTDNTSIMFDASCTRCCLMMAIIMLKAMILKRGLIGCPLMVNICCLIVICVRWHFLNDERKNS